LNFKGLLVRTILLGVAVLCLASQLAPQSDVPSDEVTQESLRFTRIYGILEENYTEPLDPDRVIFDGGIRAMLSALDPFSSFFDPDQFRQLQEQTRGRIRGFGSILYVQPGKILVLQTAQGSPSWRAGLGPGDEIVEVNGTRTSRLDLRSLIQLLQRARKQRVQLGVIRPGEVVPQNFVLNPAEVPMPTVERAFLLSPGIAFLRVGSFDQKTTQEVRDALTQLGGARLKALLLDLRANRGGVLDSAVGVASLFLKPGLKVLTVQGRAMPAKSYQTVALPDRFDMPLVVLVNGSTASAAEVVAAALQEHDRAVIAGETTFGKGVVESVAALSANTGLALTTGRYFTPSGRSIQRPIPNTALAATDPGLNTSSNSAPAFHTDNGRPVSAGGGITPDVIIHEPGLDPWVTFLNQRGAFTTFASDYLTVYGKVDRSFQPGAAILEKFKDYIGQQQIRVPEDYWKQDQDYLNVRIKTELFNLVFGLAAGDEVDTRADLQVREASRLFPRFQELLKAPPSKSGTSPAKLPARPR
jgi:carboxyl-terminal processing protease